MRLKPLNGSLVLDLRIWWCHMHTLYSMECDPRKRAVKPRVTLGGGNRFAAFLIATHLHILTIWCRNEKGKPPESQIGKSKQILTAVKSDTPKSLSRPWREMKNSKSFIILFSAYDLMREILEHLTLRSKTFSRFSSAKDFKMRPARDSELSTGRFWSQQIRHISLLAMLVEKNYRTHFIDIIIPSVQICS